MKESQLFIFLCALSGVFGADEVKSVSVMEGHSVTLQTDLTHIQTDDHILWMFGPQETLIAEIFKLNSSVCDNNRFRDRLKLDHTGSLTITDIRITDTGLYKLDIEKTSRSAFNVTVFAPLPNPKMTIKPFASGSSAKCEVQCSSSNVSHVSLSLYKNRRIISSVMNSDFSKNLFLSVNVNYEDANTYSCVLCHLISNQTTFFSIADPCNINCKAAHEPKIVSATAGVSLTLQADEFDKEAEDHILWTFRPYDAYIAEMKKSTHFHHIYRNSEGGIFTDVMLDNDTGSLTILNITERHTGLYKRFALKKDKCWIFNVTLYEEIHKLKVDNNTNNIVGVGVVVGVVGVLVLVVWGLYYHKRCNEDVYAVQDFNHTMVHKKGASRNDTDRPVSEGILLSSSSDPLQPSTPSSPPMYCL